MLDKHTRMSFSTTSLDPLADPLGTRRGPPLVRGPHFENRWPTSPEITVGNNLKEQYQHQSPCSHSVATVLWPRTLLQQLIL